MASNTAPRYSTRPAARPPARVGAPPSTRNFGDSSAAGVGRAPPRFLATGTGLSDSSGVEVGTGSKEDKVKAWGDAYVSEEDSIRNDYATHYVRTGSRPQNHLRGAEVGSRFAEYPKLASLLSQKHALHQSPTYSIPPTYLPVSPHEAVLELPPARFDVILLSPPKDVSFEELRTLDLGRVAASPGFVWLWVGSGARGDGIGLERGRELIANWGYRRCEDIVWLKTNKADPATDLTTSEEEPKLFRSTTEHCLMGIRGTVRRSNDPWFVHCNVDTDVMVWEGDPHDPQLKPPELQSLIENFCLGTRRLHLFGSPHSLRRGWLTVGDGLLPLPDSVREVEGEESKWTAIRYEKDAFQKFFVENAEVANGSSPVIPLESSAPTSVPSLLPFVEELDALRPKSPPPRNGLPSSGGLGRGRGAGLGITRSGMLGSNDRGPRGPPPNHAPKGRQQQPPMVHHPAHQQFPPQPQPSYSNPGLSYPFQQIPPPPPPPHFVPAFGSYPVQYRFLPAYHPQPGTMFYPSIPQQPPFIPHPQQIPRPTPPYVPPPSAQPSFTPTSQQQQQMFAQWVAMGGPQMMMGVVPPWTAPFVPQSHGVPPTSQSHSQPLGPSQTHPPSDHPE